MSEFRNLSDGMLNDVLHAALEKLVKWRTFFAGWQLGTRSNTDGECRAVKDHREVTIALRAEVSALVGLLIQKGVISQREWAEALVRECRLLDADYERRFPGFETGPMGLTMKTKESLETMRKLNFPP